MPAAGKTNTVHLTRGDRILVNPVPGLPGKARESLTRRKGNPVVMTVTAIYPIQTRYGYGRVQKRYDVVGVTDQGEHLTIPSVAGNQTYLLA